MGKKQYFADVLGGNKQPVSAINTPQEYIPYQAGDDFDIQKVFQPTKVPLPNPFQPSQTQPYKGEYYKGSPMDPSQRTIQGENQPWLEKLAAGSLGHMTAIATKFSTGVAEAGGGVFDAITSLIPGVAEERKETTGSYVPHLFENFMTKGIDFLENDLIQERLLPVYGGQKYHSGSFLKSMGDMKFWSDDALDAAAFMVAAAIPAGAFTKAAKAMGMIAKGGKLLKDGSVAVKAIEGGKEVEKILKGYEALSAKGKLFATLGTATYNTVQESALEAKGGLDSMRDSLAMRYYNTGYESLQPEQKTKINQEAAPYAANIFKSNIGILAGPNLIQARFFLGPVQSSASRLSKLVKTGKISSTDISLFKEAFKQSSIGVVSEGAWEEGMQNAVQNYEISRATGDSFLNRGLGYAYEWVNGFNTEEGQKSMFLGALMGLGMGARAGVKEGLANKKYVTEYKNAVDKELKSLDLYDKELIEDIKHPFKLFDVTDEKDANKVVSKSIINPKTGKAEFDLDKMIKMYSSDVNDKSVIDNLTMATLNMDPVHDKFTINQALSQLFYKYVTNPLYDTSDEAVDALLTRNQLKTLAEDEELKNLGYDYDYMVSKVRQMKTEWDNIQKKLQGREDISGDRDVLEFKKLAEKGLFYQSVKMRWLDDIDNLVENKDDISKVREDAQQSIDTLSNRESRNNLYKEWLKQKEETSEFDTAYQNEYKKDANSAETKKYKYLKDEFNTIYGTPVINDQFTIGQRPQEKTGKKGLKGQHYYNVAADAMTGIRLESEMKKLEEGKTTLGKVVDILVSAAEGPVETRGKYTVSNNDVKAVADLIPIAQEQLRQTLYTETDYVKEESDLMDRMQDGEFEVGVTMDDLTRPLKEKLAESRQKQADLENAITKLYAIGAEEAAIGVLDYSKNFVRDAKDDRIFERRVADYPVEESKALRSVVNANSEYSELGKANRILQSLKDRRQVYGDTNIKDRLETKEFKG